MPGGQTLCLSFTVQAVQVAVAVRTDTFYRQVTELRLRVSCGREQLYPRIQDAGKANKARKEGGTMFPFWIDTEFTALLQSLAVAMAAAGWLLVMLTGGRCGI